MLQILRKKAQSTFIQIIVVIIALVFIFWGVGANLNGDRQSALVVNGETITFQEFQQAYDRAYQRLSDQFGGTVPKGLAETFGVKQQVIMQLVQTTLLRQGAEKMGLQVSAQEIQKIIEEMVQFQENGVFNIDRYKTVLAANRMAPTKFEDSMRFDRLSEVAAREISNFAGAVTDFEIEELYRRQNEKIAVNYVQITPDQYVDKVTIDDTKLKAWFETVKDNYKSEPQIKLKYLAFTYDDVGSKIEIDASEAENLAFQVANDAYEGIIGAGSLTKYGETHPDMPIIQTDFFPKSNAPAALNTDTQFLDKAFELNKGELSSLIKGQTGYAILFAEDVKQPQIPAFESIKDTVVKDYQEAESKKLAESSADELLKKLHEGKTLEAMAEEMGLPVLASGFIKQSGQNDKTTFPSDLLGDAFLLSASSPLPEKPGKVGDDFFVYTFADRQVPDLPDDSEKIEQYRQNLLRAKQQQLLSAWLRHQEMNAKITRHPSL